MTAGGDKQHVHLVCSYEQFLRRKRSIVGFLDGTSLLASSRPPSFLFDDPLHRLVMPAGLSVWGGQRIELWGGGWPGCCAAGGGLWCVRRCERFSEICWSLEPTAGVLDRNLDIDVPKM